MSADEDAQVGYGRPPQQHRIKSKEVRNPRGRRGKPRPEVDFLDQPFELKMEGRVEKITRWQALDWALFKVAIEGKVSAIKELERRYRERLASTASADDDRLSPEEQRTFERCLERMRGMNADRSSGADHPLNPDAAEQGDE